MPELPEVECVRQTLSPSLMGRTIRSLRITGPEKLTRPSSKVFRQGLVGRTVTGSRRHGKLLIFELDNSGLWTIHLGMTGQVITAHKKPQTTHIHITVSFKDQGPKLYYRDIRRFGAMGYWPGQEALLAGPLKNFGQDALLISADELAARLAGRRASIKGLLLDQRILAGVGNIYADEALHIAGISPMAAPIDLTGEDLTRLHGAIQGILALALKQGGSSVRNFVDAKGRAGTFQHAHRVYQRTGQPCPTCGQSVQKTVLAGRSTHYCPGCQSQ